MDKPQVEKMDRAMRGGYMYDGEWGRINSIYLENDELIFDTTPVSEEDVPDELIDEAKSMYEGNSVIVHEDGIKL